LFYFSTLFSESSSLTRFFFFVALVIRVTDVSEAGVNGNQVALQVHQIDQEVGLIASILERRL
jgi:hypothetical protein